MLLKELLLDGTMREEADHSHEDIITNQHFLSWSGQTLIPFENSSLFSLKWVGAWPNELTSGWETRRAGTQKLTSLKQCITSHPMNLDDKLYYWNQKREQGTAETSFSLNNCKRLKMLMYSSYVIKVGAYAALPVASPLTTMSSHLTVVV